MNMRPQATAPTLPPAPTTPATDGLIWEKALSTISTLFLRPVSMVVTKVSQRLQLV